MIRKKDECEGRVIAAKHYKEIIEEYRRVRDDPFQSQLVPLLKEYELWLDDMLMKQGSMNLYDEPILKVLDINNKEDELKKKCELIMNPPKPKPEEKEEEKKEEKKDEPELEEVVEEKKEGLEEVE